jgi:hypothetical protein
VKAAIERRIKKLEDKAGVGGKITLGMILDEVNRMEEEERLLEEMDDDTPLCRPLNKHIKNDRG